MLGIDASNNPKNFDIDAILRSQKNIALPNTVPGGVRFAGETWPVDTASYGSTFTNFGNITVPAKVGDKYVANARFVYNNGAWSLQRELFDGAVMTDYVPKTDLINNLVDGVFNKPLSSLQGKQLNDTIQKKDITGGWSEYTHYINTQTGLEANSASGTVYSFTDFIKVYPGQIIYFTGTCKGVHFKNDSGKTVNTNPTGLAGYASKSAASFLSTNDGNGIPVGALWDNHRYALANGLDSDLNSDPILHKSIAIVIPAGCNYIRASSEIVTYSVRVNIQRLVDTAVKGSYKSKNLLGAIFNGYYYRVSDGVKITHADYRTTDFIPVVPGQEVYFTGQIASLNASGTAKGVAGFASNNEASFVSTPGTDGLPIGNLWGIDRANAADGTNITTSRTPYYNRKIVIPPGVNYITATSDYTSTGLPLVLTTPKFEGTLRDEILRLNAKVYFDKTETMGLKKVTTGASLWGAGDSQGLTTDGQYYFHSGAHFIEKRAISDPSTIVQTKANPAAGYKIGGLFYDAKDNVILVMGGTYEAPYETHFFRINPADLSDIMTVDVTPYSDWGCNAICRLNDFIYVGETAAAENGLKRILQFDVNMNFIQYAFAEFSNDGANDYQDMEVVNGLIYCTDHTGHVCIFKPKPDGRLDRIGRVETPYSYEGICKIPGDNTFIMRSVSPVAAIYPVTLTPFDVTGNMVYTQVTVAASGTTLVALPHNARLAPTYMNVSANNTAAAGGGAIVRQYADANNIYIVHAAIPAGSLVYNVAYKWY